MDEVSYVLEKIQLPTGYRKISPNPSLVDGLVNLVPYLVSPVDQVVNLVSSSVEIVTLVVDPVLSSVNHTLHMKSESQVADSVPSLISRTLHLKSAKVVALSPSLVDPNPHSKSEDVTQVYLINTDSPGQGGTPPVPMAPPSSTQMISIDWNHLIEPHCPS